ncbi:Cupredoxin, partial [Trichoderma citrinoviride]
LFSTLAVAALSAVASAKTIRIDVGKSGFNFSPNDIKADKGDILEFHYFAINHSVVAADFAKPCQPKASGGFFSGFFATGSGENKNVFQVTVNDTNPTWFYCSQPIGNHCSAGMVGVVNAGTDNTLADFKSAAEKVNSNESPSAGPFGGRVLSAAAASSASGSGSSTTGTSTGTATT